MHQPPIALSLLLACLTGTALAQSNLRAPKVELPTGHTYMQLGDLDGNGTVDGIVRASTGWYVMSNVGTNPTPGAAIATFADSDFSALGDVTGDGVLDLVLTYNAFSQGSTSGLQFLKGDGSGGFAAPVQLASPELIGRMVLADVDGDGVQDIVTHDTKLLLGIGYEHTVNAWFLDGAVPVAAPPQLLPTFADHIVAIDVDGDGDDEIAVARASFEPFPGDLLIVGWNAARVPSALQALDYTTAPGSTNGMQAGDVDGDGDQDMVVFELSTAQGKARVFENVSGTLVPGPLQSGLGGLPYVFDPLMVDWDGDGDDDVLYVDHGFGTNPTNLIYLLRSSGLTLELASYFYVPNQVSVPGLAGIRDLDGDGRLDLAAGRAVFHGNGSFDAVLEEFLTASCCVGGGLAEDLDGDGDLDLWNGTSSAFFNQATGFGPALPLFETSLAGNQALESVFARGDFDGDGYLDFLMEWGQITEIFPGFPQFDFLGTRLVRGLPDGTYVDGGVALGAATVGPAYSNLANTGDFDGDGDLDVLGDNGWRPNAGSGTFGAIVPGYVGQPRGTWDFDGDGDVDLLFRDEAFDQGTWRIEANDGTGQFTTAHSFTVAGKVAEKPLLFDFDGDGLVDLCFGVDGASGAEGLFAALSLGGGAFAPAQLVLPSATGVSAAIAGDVNGDGFEDLVAWLGPTSGSSASLDLWLGTVTSGSYTLETYWGSPVTVAADLDGDGDEDLIGAKRLVATAKDGPSAGSIKQYGFGFAGGLTPPLLGAQGPLVPGSPSAELRIAHGIGGASYFVYWGWNEISLLDVPLPGAGIFVSPIHLIYSGVLTGTPGVLSEGQAAINKTAWTTAIPGFTIPQQALLIHPGYPNGFALTNAVSLGYGF